MLMNNSTWVEDLIKLRKIAVFDTITHTQTKRTRLLKPKRNSCTILISYIASYHVNTVVSLYLINMTRLYVYICICICMYDQNIFYVLYQNYQGKWEVDAFFWGLGAEIPSPAWPALAWALLLPVWRRRWRFRMDIELLKVIHWISVLTLLKFMYPDINTDIEIHGYLMDIWWISVFTLLKTKKSKQQKMGFRVSFPMYTEDIEPFFKIRSRKIKFCEKVKRLGYRME